MKSCKRSLISTSPPWSIFFLVLAVFATLAVTRTVIYDTQVNLATLKPEKETPAHILHQESYVVTLSVTEEGQYKWITEFNEYLMPSVVSIQKQLLRQQELGLLPKEKEHTQVLLHIDKNAKWEQRSPKSFLPSGRPALRSTLSTSQRTINF